MGSVQHETMIITSWYTERWLHREPGIADISEVHEKAIEIFGADLVTPIIESTVNGYATFMVIGSGSKIGWQEFQSHRQKLLALRDYLQLQRYEDESSPYEWLIVSYGEGGAGIIETNCEDKIQLAETWREIWVGEA